MVLVSSQISVDACQKPMSTNGTCGTYTQDKCYMYHNNTLTHLYSHIPHTLGIYSKKSGLTHDIMAVDEALAVGDQAVEDIGQHLIEHARHPLHVWEGWQ